MVTYTVPGLKTDSAERVVKLLQDRLNSLSDLALTLKHVHWNVTGPNFIAVHTMLDPQVDAVRTMVDETRPTDTVFRTNHASNYLPLGGRLPHDRDRIVKIIDAALAGEIPLRSNAMRGL